VVPQLAPDDHVPFTKIIMPAAPDDGAAITLQIHDTFAGL